MAGRRANPLFTNAARLLDPAAMWIDLEQQSDTSFRLAVHRGIAVGPPGRMFMFGGVGLAASLTALHRVTGRPTVWATAQYENFTRVDDVVTFTVDERVRGNSVSQARVNARVGDREILSVAAALGRRDGIDTSGQWTLAPKVPAPDACPKRSLWFGDESDNLHKRVEFRIAKGSMRGPAADGPVGDGNSIAWARPNPEVLGPDHEIDEAFVAVVADFVASGIGPAIGKVAGGNSLDNSIRFHRMVATRWLLCDIRIHGIANGFAHGRMHIFAETGELIATASQSMILRIWDSADAFTGGK